MLAVTPLIAGHHGDPVPCALPIACASGNAMTASRFQGLYQRLRQPTINMGDADVQ
jgi:hypothetical protein